MIDGTYITKLPDILYQAADVCYASLEDELANKLREYAILLEGANINGRTY